MTNCKDFLNKMVNVIIDRPLGSKHSEKYSNHIYPVNYGYVPNTIRRAVELIPGTTIPNASIKPEIKNIIIE